MAIIRSTILSEIRGSINGTTYARNRYGAYARNRTVPVNPQTDAQQAIRASLTAASQAWRSISAGTRTLWENYAAATPVVNKLGETVYLSGQAMYVKYITWATSKGLSGGFNPPVTPGFAETLFAAGVAISDSLSTGPNTVEFQYTNGGTTATDQYPVWISAPQSAGTLFFKGPWHYLGILDGTTRTNPLTIPWSVTVGQLFFTKQGYRAADLKLANDLIQGPIAAVNVP